MRYLMVASPAAGNTDDSKIDVALGVLSDAGADVELAKSGSPEALDAVLLVVRADAGARVALAQVRRRPRLDAQLFDQPGDAVTLVENLTTS